MSLYTIVILAEFAAPKTTRNVSLEKNANTNEQRCAWTGFWTFWTRTPVASNKIRSEVFFLVAGSGLD